MINVCFGVKNVKDKSSQFTIYPNPSSSDFVVETNFTENKVVTLEIEDMLGKKVYSEKVLAKVGMNKITLRTAELETGVYILKINSNDTITQHKIIKN